jgi:hypothetical protein
MNEPIGAISHEEREAIDKVRQKLLDRARKARLRRLENFPDVADVPDVLWHYTDAGGLLGIVRCSYLRATHLAFMNDAKEYMHANELLLGRCKLRAGKLLAIRFSTSYWQIWSAC